MSTEQSPEDSPKASPVPSPVPEPDQLAVDVRDEVEIGEVGHEEEVAEEEEEEEELINEDHLCHICSNKLNNPRVLACLHVFCTDCLQKQLEPDTPDDGNAAGV